MNRMLGRIALVGVAVALLGPRVGMAEEGVLAGVDVGAAVPLDHLRDRANTGGVVSPFVGYMFNDYLGLLGQVQVAGFPSQDRPGKEDNDVWALGGHAGPRLALPFSKESSSGEFYATWQGGAFTGLTGDTPVSRTSWGYSTGVGVNLRLTDDLLLGAFGRYNWLDQRVQPGKDVQYVTAGLSVTYNAAPPPPPPAVAEAPPPPPAPPVRKKIVLRGVHFDFDKAVIRPDARPVLDEAISVLKREGGIAVIAEGHTDSKGTPAYNQKLSVRRAHAVRDYLVAGGIAPSRVQAEGFGETHPVASNDTSDGRAQNRRVELRIRGN